MLLEIAVDGSIDIKEAEKQCLEKFSTTRIKLIDLNEFSDDLVMREVIEDGIQIIEGVMIEYDSNGKEIYYYASQEMEASHEISSTEIEELMNHLYEEMENAEVIHFDTIQR